MLQKIKEFIKRPDINNYDKLRLVLIFALRYEGDGKVDTLKADLGVENVPNVHLVDLILRYAGKERRKAGLFAGEGLLERAAKAVREAFKVTWLLIIRTSRMYSPSIGHWPTPS